ncbi:hypothetical protein Hamer_G018636 [Homarus americanus]|uniref:Uncharacterized protein n=1 Tax=Homarus americanus TaxID=6706 RepID=A0A8J5TJW8_HOMAM|nr:hypothetical protein Hamer_G018636 [Homarus americanus]
MLTVAIWMFTREGRGREGRGGVG